MGQVYNVPVVSNPSSYDSVAANGMVIWHGFDIGTNQDFIAYLGTDKAEIHVAGYEINDDRRHLLLAGKQVFTIGIATKGLISGQIGFVDVYADRDQESLGTGFYSTLARTGTSDVGTFIFDIDYFNTFEDAKSAVVSSFSGNPIIYRLTNCAAPGAPESGISGNLISVRLTPNTGYDFVNPETDIFVTNNGVAVPSTFTDGVLTFTMP